MEYSRINTEQLFDGDSIPDLDGSISEESESVISDGNEPKMFLSTLSRKNIVGTDQNNAVNPQTGEIQSIRASKKGICTPQEAEEEVKKRTSFRRKLSFSRTFKEDTSSQYGSASIGSYSTEVVASPLSIKNTMSIGEPAHSIIDISSKESGVLNEPMMSYINLQASKDRLRDRIRSRLKKSNPVMNSMQNMMLFNIFINRKEQNDNRFPRNLYITSKYTVWSFIPRNLFDQFGRIANFVFLIVALIQLIPDVSPFSIWSTLFPLLFILIVSAIKEGWEDYKRHKSDDITNHVQYKRVKPNGEVESVPSCDLVPGDIVILNDQDCIPADVLVLTCSDSDGTCYVDTSSLDGETNLKEKEAVEVTKLMSGPEEMSKLKGTLTCQIPNKELSSFQGVLSIYEQNMPVLEMIQEDQSEVAEVTEVTEVTEEERSKVSQATPVPSVEDKAAMHLTSLVEAPVDSHNLLLRGCVLRNSNWVAALIVYTGRFTKLSLNMNTTKFKYSGIESSLNSFVPKVVLLQIAVSIISTTAARFYDGTALYYHFISSINTVSDWIFGFCSCFVLYSYFIPMSMYVVFEFSRTVQALLMENDLDEYVENEGGMHVATSTLNEELGNVDFILSDKTGTLTKNNMTCYGFSMGGIEYRMQDFLDNEKTERESDEERIKRLILKRNSKEDLSSLEKEYIVSYLRALLICNSIKPVEQDGAIILRAESADEEALLEGATHLGWRLLLRTKDSVIIQEGYPTVLPSVDPNGSEKSGRSPLNEVSKFITEHFPAYHKFEVLEELEFTSARQRMTIVVRDLWSSRICLYSKGADSKMIYLSCDDDVLDNNPSDDNSSEEMRTSDGGIDLVEMERHGILKRIDSYLRGKSAEGYRLLLVGGRYVSEKEYYEWRKDIDKAKKSMKEREEAIEHAFTYIERDMSILGVTAVEDELQEHIKEDISLLRQAGIVVAMATGDKKETALIIAKNCGLMNDSMTVFDLTGKRDCVEIALENVLEHSNYKHAMQLQEWKKKDSIWARMMACGSKRAIVERKVSYNDYIMILDGTSVDLLIRTHQAKFVYAMTHACSIICSRMSPKQKSRIIMLMKNEGKCCLAIGDGANDVSMIKEASVGIGVKGKEGNAAVNNADYIIRRFHHLIKLLFVFGRNNYRGNSYSIYSAFFENITFSMPLFLYSFFSMFSAQTIYSSFQLSTSFMFMCPLFASFGWFYTDLKKETLLATPQIYKCGKQNSLFSGKKMWMYIFGSVLNALVCFFIPYAVFQSTQTIQGGFPLELWSLAFCVYTNIILSSIIIGALMVPKWNCCFLIFFILPVVFYFLVTLAILFVVQDELYDSLPIIIRSPVFYLQVILCGVTIYVFYLMKTALEVAFKPEMWRVYAEKEASEAKRIKIHPVDSIDVEGNDPCVSNE